MVLKGFVDVQTTGPEPYLAATEKTLIAVTQAAQGLVYHEGILVTKNLEGNNQLSTVQNIQVSPPSKAE